MVGEEVGEDLEQVEEMQKKFDDFQKVAYCRVLMKGYSPKNKKQIFFYDFSKVVLVNKYISLRFYTKLHVPSLENVK